MTAKSIDVTGGSSLYIYGAINGAVGGTGGSSLVDVSGAAGFGTAGAVTGNIGLWGHATLEFATGGITTIGTATTEGSVTLSDDAFFEIASSPGSNSALTGLTTIASSSDWLALEDDATVTTSGALTNNGGIYLENGGSLTVGGALNTDDVLYMDYFYQYTGGSTLTVNGTLTNKGEFYVGNLSLEHDETINATSFVNDLVCGRLRKHYSHRGLQHGRHQR